MALSGGKPKPIENEAALYEYAVGALGRRMRTDAEMRRLLRARAPAGEGGEAMIEAVLARLRERRYLDDARYAAMYSSIRQQGRKLGPRRVAMDLQQRGVPAEIVRSEVQAAYAGVDEAAQARAFLQRKRVAPPADDRAAARIFRMLVRAGFSMSVITKLVKSRDGSDWGTPEDA